QRFARRSIIAEDRRRETEFSQILHEVIRKRIVVVDHDNHDAASSAIAIAFNIAFALLTVSSYSRSGIESATIPAPVCTYATPSLMMTVRIVMHESIFPEN